MISNFARPLNDESINMMVRYDSIQVSIDTSDAELFSRIRRGARLEVLLDNIDRVRSHAKASGLRIPTIRFDIVVTDKTIMGLPDLIRLGLAHGVSDFYLANLIKGPDTKGPFNVYNADTLPPAEIARAADALDQACDLALSAGCSVECHPGLRESLRRHTQGRCESTALSWGAPGVGDSMTRNCAEPWKYVFLCADGQVKPCCAYDVAIGDLRTESLKQIVNGQRIRDLRAKLLSGNLAGTLCEHCSLRAEISVHEFQKRIGGLKVLWSIRRLGLNIVSEWWRN
jgi:MoaA/NifB/PqqE/SkfB family radical SAM enzyme